MGRERQGIRANRSTDISAAIATARLQKPRVRPSACLMSTAAICNSCSTRNGTRDADPRLSGVSRVREILRPEACATSAFTPQIRK